MAEIRQIREGDGEAVAALWDEDARTGIDGAPLTARSAWAKPAVTAGALTDACQRSEGLPLPPPR